MIRALATGLSFAAPPLFAGDIVQTDYQNLAGQLSGLVDFEGFATMPEPGQPVAGVLSFPGLQIGAYLAGQTPGAVGGFDTLAGLPNVPVTVKSDNTKAPIAVAFHAGFGSNAAFPLGPDGFENRSGRGEGALAFGFDGPVETLGLKIHADYADPLGTRLSPGPVTLTFYDAHGDEVGRETVTPIHGVNEYGFLVSPPARAVTLTHRDPGGIAIDDIRYSLDSLGS